MPKYSLNENWLRNHGSCMVAVTNPRYTLESLKMFFKRPVFGVHHPPVSSEI